MIKTIWKSRLFKFAGSALLGLSVLALAPQANAETAPVSGSSAAAPAPQAGAENTIQLAQWGPPPPRGWEYPPNNRRYPPRYYDRRYYGPRYAPPPPRYRRSHAHVRWCLNRYRSYNPRTDQYLGYDGYYHYCRSPYR
ncbi:BA14K family protein [Roseibium sp.]|uniref:BA14K family protein n=1 Tax=Roseibium sp. TaxID=1936156 RepID=UPI003A9691D0